MTVVLLMLGTTVVLPDVASSAAATCTGNEIVCENELPGTDPSIWDDVDGAGDDSIQGFGTQMSVNRGETIDFKIKTAASAYSIKIFRLGYYQGKGARLVADVTPSATLPQTQPDCATDPATEIYDCGTWGVSASWAVPSTAVSGVYLALLRSSTNGTSQIPFIVRNDASHSDLVFQTSDPTWQAYNTYGVSNFYHGLANGRAYKVSYNRPFATRGNSDGRDYLFSNEFPMIQFLERNGYDISYISGLDTDIRGNLLTNHKAFLSVGHDEYWSQGQRDNVEAARDAGVNLAFFSGNEVYWRTRWEPSEDGANTANRTLVCYKDTWANLQIDPVTSTSTWRDPRFGVGEPENALTGTAYMSNDTDLAITVSAEEGKTRLWRNSGLQNMAADTNAQLAPHTVGYESDEDLDNGFRPAGLVRLSTTTGPTPQYLTDFGSTVVPGTTTHHVTMYRAASGALVFGAGTIQWAWGLDEKHDGTVSPVDTRMQQATVNILADMGATATTLSSPNINAATKSNDTTEPTAVITSPSSGSIAQGSTVTITGTATDAGGGVVAGTEVSLDNGATWHPAIGNSTFSYTGVVIGSGSSVIQARATDDSGNIQSVPATIGGSVTCPCSIFGSAEPTLADAGDGSAVTLGVKFTSSQNGFATGIRFYKAAGNTGTHTGTLYKADGTALSTVTFANETATGWQNGFFPAAIALTAGETYIAAYRAPNGHYSADNQFFAYRGVTAGPLTALGGYGNANGMYTTGSGVPNASFRQTNYYVDVLYSTTDTTPLSVVSTSPSNGATSVAVSSTISATFSRDVQPASVALTIAGPQNQAVEGAVTYDQPSRTARFTPLSPLGMGTTYSVSANATSSDVGALPAPATWTFTTALPDGQSGVCPCTLFSDSNTPTVSAANDPNSVEVGAAFSADTTGQVTGVRFYKDATNTGQHSISLWNSSGDLLAKAPVGQESASGWQLATFASPVTVTSGTTYIASYRAPVGRYSYSAGGLGSPIDKTPLHTPANAGRYTYGSGAPLTGSSANYFVDPVFTVDSTTAPSVTAVTPANGAAAVPLTTSVSVNFNTAVQPGSVAIVVTDGSGTPVAGTTINQGVSSTASFAPSAPLAASTTYTITASGAKNLGGTAMAGPFTATFTTSGTGSCPCSVFPVSAAPAVLNSGDTAAVSLGLRFTSDTSGFITGLRYYRDAANTGTHTGTLYSATGSVLAALTYADGDPGWQTAYFDTAVPVTAGTTYVASTFMPSGHYSYTTRFFDTNYVNSPLTGVMGTYNYGSDSFPSSTYGNANYWVDAIFSTQDPANATPPATPANVTATAGSGTATVAWTAPNNGGSPITSYTVIPSGGPTTINPITISGSNPATTAVVGGLTNGAAYTFTVTATNAKGTSAASASSVPVTPAPTTPGAPSAVNATSGDGKASVSWTAPVVNGGSDIIGYTVTPYIGTAPQSTKSTTDTSVIVDGLTNGTAYTFTVTASNVAGSGSASAASAAVTPAGLPAAPTGVGATATNGAATVTWTAPANTGGVPLTGYVVTPFIGGTAQTAVTVTGTPPATGTTITGLTNGTAYTFTVAAANGVGQGAASPASPAVTPATVPGAPTAVTAVAGNTQATVSWAAPALNGGSAITGYTVTPYMGTTAGTPRTVTGTGTSTTVTGLTNNTAYTFVVAAINGVGTGAASAASTPVTPVPPTVPGVPSNVTGTPGNTQVALTWTAPSDGGAQITRYTVTPYIGTIAQTARPVNGTPAATNLIVTGLTNGTAYTFRVTAMNSAGTSTTYGVSGSITPATTPGAPTIGTMTANDAGVTVRWTAPSSTGGSAITGYVVTPYIGSTAQTSVNVAGTGTSTNVTGLTNGTAYTFRVAAVNVMGTGAPSNASAATTPFGVPGAPTNVTAVAGAQSAFVSWSAPGSTGGSAITGYTVTRLANGVIQGTTSATATNATIDNLTIGATYTFTVTATNTRGTSAASAPSAAIKPLFVQGVATRGTGTTSITATPTANLTAGNRLIVMVGVKGTSTTTAQLVSDAANNTYTKVTSFRGSDNTEMSIWTAPITAGAGTRPVVTARSSASATMAVTVTEYAGLSTAAGTGSVDVFKTATGTATISGTAQSGATTGSTGAGEVAIGFYLDGGPARTISTPTGYASRIAGANNSSVEYAIVDQTLWPVGTTANAAFTISAFASMPWLAATVVFKRG